jgi:hypothetical protein
MDSDKFDRIVLDLLYGELDELTTAAARRHMEQSARAREIYAHFRATRQLGVLPSHAPPADFESALLAREARLMDELPVRQRMGRLVSMLAGYAMRPQLIMGALLLLMLGSSLMFVRTRPGLHLPVQVTERGSPESDVDVVLPLAPPPGEAAASAASSVPPAAPQSAAAEAPAASPARVPLPPVASAPAGGEAPVAPPMVDPIEHALQLYRDRSYAEARRAFEAVARSGGPRAAEAALHAALSTRNISGCAAALAPLARVQSKFPRSSSAREAQWRSARCHEQLGDVAAARSGYEALLHLGSHARRAERALARLAGAEGKEAEGSAAAGSAAATPSGPVSAP